jgi:hypothetical protein
MPLPISRMPGLALETGIWTLAALAVVGLGWAAANPAGTTAYGLEIDRLTTTLTLLVAVVGAVTFRFARRYLLGEQGQRRFLWWHAAAIVSAMLLMLSGNLVLLWATWTCTSVALHELLTHYAHRPQAWPPARKKFLISRLGDVALITAILIIAFGYSTTDLGTFIAAAMASPGAWPVQIVATCIVIAALTKSAQFPFHSWLPETMEAPTPVSALMHAGIINAGGALVLKFAPVVAASPVAVCLLVGVGVVTAILGMLSMWAQTNVKRTLAWSTVSQMGFMMIQVGLGVFPAAILHIVGHGCYKAWNFLACGWVTPATALKPMAPALHLALVTVGTLAAGAVIGGFCWSFGIDLWHHPGEAALFGVLAIAIGQAWPIVLARPVERPTRVSPGADGSGRDRRDDAPSCRHRVLLGGHHDFRVRRSHARLAARGRGARRHGLPCDHPCHAAGAFHVRDGPGDPNPRSARLLLWRRRRPPRPNHLVRPRSTRSQGSCLRPDRISRAAGLHTPWSRTYSGASLPYGR